MSDALPVELEAKTEIQEKYVYCAVLDVLGYKSLLEEDRKSGRRDFKKLLHSALSVLGNINQVECQYEAISDTIFLVWPNRETLVDFLVLVKSLFVSFLENGLFLRGGISYSPHFRSGHVTYSFAIATAYRLESERAIYPRIIIDGSIIEMHQGPNALPAQVPLIDSRLVCRQNGSYFLNVMDQKTWMKLYQAASRLFKSSSVKLEDDESAFAKHVWFENFLFQSPLRPGEIERYIPTPQLLDIE